MVPIVMYCCLLLFYKNYIVYKHVTFLFHGYLSVHFLTPLVIEIRWSTKNNKTTTEQQQDEELSFTMLTTFL